MNHPCSISSDNLALAQFPKERFSKLIKKLQKLCSHKFFLNFPHQFFSNDRPPSSLPLLLITVSMLCCTIIKAPAYNMLVRLEIVMC